MEKLRLLAVVDHLGGGGAEKQFAELVKGLHLKGHEVRVFISEGGGVRLPGLIGQGVDVVSWSPGALTPGHSGRRTFTSFKALAAQMRDFRPEVTLGWLSYSITLCALASLVAPAGAMVFSERSSLERLFDVEVSFGSIKKKILKEALSRARLVVTNTESVIDEYLREGYCTPAQARVVRNGVDVKAISALPDKYALRKSLGMEDGKVYGVYVGRYEERKGVRHLLQALDGIDRQSLEMIMIGQGSLEEELARSGLVRVIGYRENAVEYIRAADLHILPSLYEGLPNVVLEAMAAGTPSIATRVQGTPELIEDGVSGLLVPPADPGALAEAIDRLYKDETLRVSMGMAAKQLAEQFSMENMVGSFESVFVDSLS